MQSYDLALHQAGRSSGWTARCRLISLITSITISVVTPWNSAILQLFQEKMVWFQWTKKRVNVYCMDNGWTKLINSLKDSLDRRTERCFPLLRCEGHIWAKHKMLESKVRQNAVTSYCKWKADSLLLHALLKGWRWYGNNGEDERARKAEIRIPGNRKNIQGYVLTYSKLERENFWQAGLSAAGTLLLRSRYPIMVTIWIRRFENNNAWNYDSIYHEKQKPDCGTYTHNQRQTLQLSYHCLSKRQ